MGLSFDAVFSVSVFMLVSMGLFVILELMNIVNLAHSAFMAVAVYAELYFLRSGSSFWIAAAAAIGVTTVLGALVEMTIVRRLYGRHIDDTILATWGVSLVLVQIWPSLLEARPRRSCRHCLVALGSSAGSPSRYTVYSSLLWWPPSSSAWPPLSVSRRPA